MEALRERAPVTASPPVETFRRLDNTLASLVRWDAEKLGWAALLFVVLLSRVIGLGQRAISYDESLHALYAWRRFQGQGHQHNPLTHGPLKFELTVVLYRRYTTPTPQWEPVHRISVFVRKDVAAQVWDWAGATVNPNGG